MSSEHPETIAEEMNTEERATLPIEWAEMHSIEKCGIESNVDKIVRSMNDLKAIRTFIKEELKDGLDYGAIPGTTDKKVLLLPGAQKVCMYFNVRPEFRVQRTELPDGHLEVYVETDIIDRRTDRIVGAGVGSCSTMETKYRFRKMERLCPSCGAAAITRGKKWKPTDPETWFCWKKKGGCGRVFEINDPSITSQQEGQKENENIHDQRNTCLKMGKKRSLIDAAIGLGCLSELFTQDLDDFYDLEPVKENGAKEVKPPPIPQESKETVGKEILAHAAEEWFKAESYTELLNLYEAEEVAAHRFGVFNEYVEEKVAAFKTLRDKKGVEPLIPIPADGESYWLEFYALDEAARQGQKEVARGIYLSRKDKMGPMTEIWKNYGKELAKEVAG